MPISDMNITGTFFNIRSSNMGSMHVTAESCSPVDLSDGRFGGRGRNSLQALFNCWCSLHFASFRVPTPTRFQASVVSAGHLVTARKSNTTAVRSILLCGPQLCRLKAVGV